MIDDLNAARGELDAFIDAHQESLKPSVLEKVKEMLARDSLADCRTFALIAFWVMLGAAAGLYPANEASVCLSEWPSGDNRVKSARGCTAERLEYAVLSAVAQVGADLARVQEVRALALAGESPNIIYNVGTVLREGRSAAKDSPSGSSWVFLDLGPSLTGERERLEPTILRRTDGRGLLYPGRINGIHADSGVGKGWLVLYASAQHLDDGGHVVWFDFEDPNEDLLIDRLRLVGVDDRVIAERVHYVNPDEPADPGAVDRLLANMEDFGPCFAVIDSTGEALGLQGGDENKDLDVDGWARLLPKALERVGHTVVLVDHSTKANDNPLHPSGSKRKRALISGASWHVELERSFAEGQPGTLKLVCAKDRHGRYRRKEVGAVVHLDGTPSGMRIAVDVPETATGAGTTRTNKAVALVGPVVAVLKEAGEDGLSLQKLRANVRLIAEGSNQVIDDAVLHAESLGCISITPGGQGRATTHRWVRDLELWDLEGLAK